MMCCPHCGSTDTRFKGIVTSKTLGKVRLLRCKNCKRRFRQRYVRDVKRVNPQYDLVEKYFEAKSLKTLAQMLSLSRSEKTVHRWLVNQLQNYTTWEEFLPEMAKRVRFSYIMGIDTTDLRISGKKYNYLHVVDYPSNHLAYKILESRNVEEIKRVLLKIKALMGYEPIIVITDRAKELLQAIKDIYPKAIIQGCLFHLRDWLDKKLPTRKINDPHKIREWNLIKGLVMRAALATNYNEKEKYLGMLREKLLSKSTDRKVRNTIRNFLKDANYYHPLQELLMYGCRPGWRYNNVCERAMKNVKELGRNMCGFKSLNLAKRYINAMWIIEARKNMNFSSSKISKGTSYAYTLPLTLFMYDKYIDLEEAARAHNVSVDVMKSNVEMAGYIVAGDTAFAKDYVDTLLKEVLTQPPKTLYELMNRTSLDFNRSAQLAQVLGLKLKYYSLGDPRRIFLFLGYSNLVTDEKAHIQTNNQTTCGHE